MQFQDYYSTLGVDKKASASEIQKAYRRLARKHHPDVNRDPGSESRFKEIGEAYQVLSDEEKRQKYDQYGSAWNRVQDSGSPPPGWESFNFDLGGGSGGFETGNSGFSSFFEMLFGDQARGFQQGGGPRWNTQQARPNVAGQDRESRLSLTLEELARGGKKSVELVDPVTGARKSLVVTLPKGVLPGKKIRLKGQGDPGMGGAPGDLFLTLEAKEHPNFRLHGRNLHTEVAVTPWEAALGANVSIPTLDDRVEIKLPPGTPAGRKTRLRGKGLPNPSGTDGDLLVSFTVAIPEKLTDEERELFERLAEVSSFVPSGRST